MPAKDLNENQLDAELAKPVKVTVEKTLPSTHLTGSYTISFGDAASPNPGGIYVTINTDGQTTHVLASDVLPNKVLGDLAVVLKYLAQGARERMGAR